MITGLDSLLKEMTDTADICEKVANDYLPLAPHLKLTKLFESCDASNHHLRWDELWKAGDHLPWDQGCESPALAELVISALSGSLHASGTQQSSPLLPPIDSSTGLRRKALVPGCGRGYDVLLLALAGYNVVGLDISSHAVEAAKAWTEAFHQRDGEATGSGGRRGSVDFVCGDFFQDDWLGKASKGFDIIYDYTVSLS